MTHNREPHLLLRFASQRPFLTSLSGSVLCLLCFPPFGWWPLAWFATLPFIALIATPDFQAKRPMRSIWFAGLLYWAAETYYISIPHPALYIAWGMLFSYLSVYPVLFVWIGRKIVHDQKLSVLIAAPVVFTMLEWVRAHMLTGFGFSMMANSQYEVPIVLQVCDVAGGYGLTFLMLLFATGVFQFVSRRRVSGIVVSAGVLAIVFGYGYLQLERFDKMAGKKLDVAIMQGNVDTRFPSTEAELKQYREQLFREYLELQTEWHRINNWPVPELVIWPEGKYPIPHMIARDESSVARERQDFRIYHGMIYRELVENKKWTEAPRLPTMIVGTNTIDMDQDKTYNSALLIGDRGRVTNTYHKMHMVPFGEFIPFGKWFPFLARITPIGSGFDSGESPKGFQVGEMTGVPYVCFESAVTHLVRESIVYLRASGQEPDFLVNVTDDGWFYGHALLDHHLACNVLRAVENRKPMMVAANTGFSAFVQSDGQILKQGPRRKSDVLRLEMPLKPGKCMYTVLGDWPAVAMAVMCVLAIILPCRKKNPSGEQATNE